MKNYLLIIFLNFIIFPIMSQSNKVDKSKIQYDVAKKYSEVAEVAIQVAKSLKDSIVKNKTIIKAFHTKIINDVTEYKPEIFITQGNSSTTTFSVFINGKVSTKYKDIPLKKFKSLKNEIFSPANIKKHHNSTINKEINLSDYFFELTPGISYLYYNLTYESFPKAGLVTNYYVQKNSLKDGTEFFHFTENHYSSSPMVVPPIWIAFSFDGYIKQNGNIYGFELPSSFDKSFDKIKSKDKQMLFPTRIHSSEIIKLTNWDFSSNIIIIEGFEDVKFKYKVEGKTLTETYKECLKIKIYNFYRGSQWVEDWNDSFSVETRWLSKGKGVVKYQLSNGLTRGLVAVIKD